MVVMGSWRKSEERKINWIPFSTVSILYARSHLEVKGSLLSPHICIRGPHQTHPNRLICQPGDDTRFLHRRNKWHRQEPCDVAMTLVLNNSVQFHQRSRLVLAEDANIVFQLVFSTFRFHSSSYISGLGRLKCSILWCRNRWSWVVYFFPQCLHPKKKFLSDAVAVQMFKLCKA